MNREKKELVKKITRMSVGLEMDDLMGPLPNEIIEAVSDKIMELENDLARLQGFQNWFDKWRWEEENLPWDVVVKLHGLEVFDYQNEDTFWKEVGTWN